MLNASLMFVRCISKMSNISTYSWDEIKERINRLNPSLYEMIAQVQPCNTIPFFIASYDFGEHWSHQGTFYLPDSSGTLHSIASPKTESFFQRHLGYGKNSYPLGMIIDKYSEWHYRAGCGRVYPEYLLEPGSIFNTPVIFDPHGIGEKNNLSVSAGALSSFLLPNIGCKTKHERLQRHFSITADAPKSTYEHSAVFKELLQKQSSKSHWQNEVLFFSEEFVRQVQQNEHWIKLKIYFFDLLTKRLLKKNQRMQCYDLFYSAKKLNRYKPAPYIIDTAKYIFKICMESGLGVKPTTDEQYLPIREIQQIYYEHYGLMYTPTMMVPATLNSTESVYYPLLCPLVSINAFKSNTSNSVLNQLEILKNVLFAYQEEFSADNTEVSGSSLYYASRQTEFAFYHHQDSHHQQIANSLSLIKLDERFSSSYCDEDTSFASEAKLFRGCVRISKHA